MREFGLKAFRRPLRADEQSRYEGLFRRESDFFKGAQIAVEAMLQSPHFLFRLDETSDPKLKPYVTAGRLAYALWDSMPDAALMPALLASALLPPFSLSITRRFGYFAER